MYFCKVCGRLSEKTRLNAVIIELTPRAKARGVGFVIGYKYLYGGDDGERAQLLVLQVHQHFPAAAAFSVGTAEITFFLKRYGSGFDRAF